MNKVILMGRLVRDPEVRYSQGAEPLAVARYTLAVNRRFKRQGSSNEFVRANKNFVEVDENYDVISGVKIPKIV